MGELRAPSSTNGRAEISLRATRSMAARRLSGEESSRAARSSTSVTDGAGTVASAPSALMRSKTALVGDWMTQASSPTTRSRGSPVVTHGSCPAMILGYS